MSPASQTSQAEVVHGPEASSGGSAAALPKASAGGEQMPKASPAVASVGKKAPKEPKSKVTKTVKKEKDQKAKKA